MCLVDLFSIQSFSHSALLNPKGWENPFPLQVFWRVRKTDTESSVKQSFLEFRATGTSTAGGIPNRQWCFFFWVFSRQQVFRFHCWTVESLWIPVNEGQLVCHVCEGFAERTTCSRKRPSAPREGQEKAMLQALWQPTKRLFPLCCDLQRSAGTGRRIRCETHCAPIGSKMGTPLLRDVKPRAHPAQRGNCASHASVHARIAHSGVQDELQPSTRLGRRWITICHHTYMLTQANYVLHNRTSTSDPSDSIHSRLKPRCGYVLCNSVPMTSPLQCPTDAIIK